MPRGARPDPPAPASLLPDGPAQLLYAAGAALAVEATPVAGGWLLRTPDAPLALTEAVWGPEAARVAELAGGCAAHGVRPAVLTTGPGAVEDALAQLGWAPSCGVALDPARDPNAPSGGPRPDAGAVHLGWDGAGEVAREIADAHSQPEAAASLATLLASATAADDRVRLLSDTGEGDARAVCVVVEDDASAVVLLAAGPAEALVARTLAAARGLGKRTGWARATAPDAADAVVWRWEPET